MYGLPFGDECFKGRKVIMSIIKSLSIFHRAANIGDRVEVTLSGTPDTPNNSLTDKGKRGYTDLFVSGLWTLPKLRSGNGCPILI
jgi:hypothetical protein